MHGIAGADEHVAPRNRPGLLAIHHFVAAVGTNDLDFTPVGEVRKIAAGLNGLDHPHRAHVRLASGLMVMFFAVPRMSRLLR